MSGREHFLADCLMHQHANLAGNVLINHLSASITVTPPPSTALVTEPTPDVAQLPVSDNVVESDLLDCYPVLISEFWSALPPHLAFLQSMNLFALASFALHFNTILDSECTTHIIKDRQYFWMYHSKLATPVGTANCGVLNTLA